MKHIPLLLIAIGFQIVSFAQSEEKHPSKASQAYHEFRKKNTRPPYGLEKVLSLINKTEKVREEDEDAGTWVIAPKAYASLSFREKFTYHMIHGESFAQNCDISFADFDEEKKIYAEVPSPFSEEYWSDKQVKFFSDNHDSVVAVMTESIGRSHRAGVNYKQVIVKINATEMIPLLISTYNIDKKDHDILTVLNLLMLNNKYQPFMTSDSYRKLYAKEDSRWEAHLTFNEANEALILQRATDFYNGLPKKN